jgi:hypothetical protein
MKNYNYADEIIKDNDWPYQQKSATRYFLPREEFLIPQNQNSPATTNDNGYANDDVEEKRKAYQERIRKK